MTQTATMIEPRKIELIQLAALGAPWHVLELMPGRIDERRRLGVLEERRGGRWQALTLVPSLGEPLLVELGEPFGTRAGALNEVLRVHGIRR